MLATLAAGAPVAEQPAALSQYARRTWTGLDGLPENAVTAMTLSTEGAVMVATELGPFRFDGVHFVPVAWNKEAWGRIASSMLTNGDELLVGSESALVRVRPAQTEVEPEWTEASADRTAQYTNLPPGRYRFHVIGANEDGVWNTEGTSVEVDVPPRLWERWWFRGLAVLLTLLAVGTWVRVRETQLKTREAEVARLVAQKTQEFERAKPEAEQTTRAKTDFLANMSHEIRTPLNAVISASELFDLTSLTADQREYLD